MNMSEQGIALIKEFEGCKLKAYRCPANVLTIGIGHTALAGHPAVTEGMTITAEEAETILRSDLRNFERGVDSCVKVELQQCQYDALVSFAYNCGLGNLRSSTLLKRVNAKNFDAVPAEFMKWTRGGGKVLPGLVRRRHAESALWSNATSAPADEEESRLTPERPAPVKTIRKSKEGNAALITGVTSGVGVLSQVSDQAQTAGTAIDTLTGLLHNTSFIIMLVAVAAAAGIWYWRKQRLDEDAA